MRETEHDTWPAQRAFAGRPRAAELDARKDALLRTATRLFVAHGYEGSSLEAIAREARVAVRTIYVQFGGKEGLFSAAAALWCADLHARLDGGADNADQPGIELADLLTDLGLQLNQVLSNPTSVMLFKEIIGGAPHTVAARTSYMMAVARLEAVLADVFAGAAVRQQWRSTVPLAILTSLFINSVLGNPLQATINGARHEAAPTTRQSMAMKVALFLEGGLA